MIKEYAYAKINLALDVVKKRDDGYHELQMIMIPIQLHDTLIFEHADEVILSSNIEIQNNHILKAVQLMKETYHVNKGVKITLNKAIPIGAGLGGGSADIAATLRGLNILWDLKLEMSELEPIALALGSDTLFCLYNEPAYVYGRGEHMLKIQMPQIESILLLTPNINVSTKNIFDHYKIKYKKRKFETLFIQYLNENYTVFFNKTYNSLMKTTLKCYPDLKKMYQIYKKVYRFIQMSGSGSTFYILSFNQNISVVEEKIKNYGLEYIKTKPKT